MPQVVKFESVERIKSIFPEGEANEDNFVLFSTSGVHGTYGTIEDLEFEVDNEGLINNHLTVLICHPRILSFQFGHIEIDPEDIDYLKKLRQSSWAVVSKIGILQ